MSYVTDQIDHIRFAPLPRPRDASGAPRRVDIEITFGGLSERAAARCLRDSLGGQIEDGAAHEVCLTDTAIGTVRIHPETGLNGQTITAQSRLGFGPMRRVVPVGLVTEPMRPEVLPVIDELRHALRERGSRNAGDSRFIGFRVHLNPAVAGASVHDILPVARAYALLEEWLHSADPAVDAAQGAAALSQSADPYPCDFVDDLVRDAPNWSLDAFWCMYLHYNKTRNRGLDLLPLIAHLSPGRLDGLHDCIGTVSPRAAFHYRLPDCRLDREDWSLAYEWNRWVMVERLADDPHLCARLAKDWQDYRAAGHRLRSGARRDWCNHVEGFLRRHSLATAQACMVQ